MIGGGGNDTYFVDQTGDVATEAISGGTDQLFASGNFTLSNGSEIEELRIDAGVTSIVLAGNDLAQQIFGRSGVTATLKGGGGDDTIRTDDANEVVHCSKPKSYPMSMRRHDSLTCRSRPQIIPCGTLDALLPWKVNAAR